jgi:hypothetical protein
MLIKATGMKGKMTLFVGFSRKMDCLPAVVAMVYSGKPGLKFRSIVFVV